MSLPLAYHLRSAASSSATLVVLTFALASSGCGGGGSPAASGVDGGTPPSRGTVDGLIAVQLPDGGDADAGAPGPSEDGGGGQGGAEAPDTGAAADAAGSDASPVLERPTLDLSSNRLESIVVAPQRADPAITSSTAAEQQYALWDTRVKTQRERLVVLIPSEGADPAAQRELGEIVAGYGFHVVLPGYVNRGFLVPPCLIGARCSAAALHRERLEGIDTSDGITVAPQHGLERRIARMLAYLASVNPAGDWGFYLAGDVPRWDRIVVGGFSEGGTMAVFTGLHRKVSRVVMLGAPWAPNQDWVTIANAATPGEAFYGFVHQRADRYSEITVEWMALGLVPLGPLTSIDGASPPYGQSHRLQSNAAVAGELCAHFSAAPGDCAPTRADGSYLFAPVWRYLFTGE